MKIYGIGIDIINILRIKKSLKNRKLLKRLFNKNEMLKCNKQINKENCYAKKFAAKEAFSKAIGIGISKGISFNEIIVQNNKLGKIIKFFGKNKSITNFFTKLADDGI